VASDGGFPGALRRCPRQQLFQIDLFAQRKFEKTKANCTDVFFAQALRWIESVKGKKPFYCYVTPNAPHAPLHVRPEDEKRYTDRVKEPERGESFSA